MTFEMAGRGRWLMAPAALVVVAWLPAHRRASGAAVPAPVPAGAYVLARAASARPPIPFQFQMAGGVVAGTVDSARRICRLPVLSS